MHSCTRQHARRGHDRTDDDNQRRRTSDTNHGKRVYWHRELPPLNAEIMGEHVLEATSGRVQGTLAHRDELWDQCYRDLLANTRERFTQEIDRLGGRYAHVLDEHVDSRHDDVAGEAWLRGRFTYVLYR
jgi:hypothetical protein